MREKSSVESRLVKLFSLRRRVFCSNQAFVRPWQADAPSASKQRTILSRRSSRSIISMIISLDLTSIWRVRTDEIWWERRSIGINRSLLSRIREEIYEGIRNNGSNFIFNSLKRQAASMSMSSSSGEQRRIFDTSRLSIWWRWTMLWRRSSGNNDEPERCKDLTCVKRCSDGRISSLTFKKKESIWFVSKKCWARCVGAVVKDGKASDG